MDSMKKKIAYLLLLLMLIPVGSFAKEKRTFEIKDGHFYVNGKVTPILSGEMHYPRIPHQYWRHRLRMMRAMGLNTVATYVFWNLHETEPGKWDFEGDKNLAEYIRIAGEEGLMVILRPGPYVCAEWEFGGYPWWLQNIPGMEIRRAIPEFLEQYDRGLLGGILQDDEGLPRLPERRRAADEPPHRDGRAEDRGACLWRGADGEENAREVERLGKLYLLSHATAAERPDDRHSREQWGLVRRRFR